jgi:hypothetical protein
VYRYVRTSAAFAAASLGDDPLGVCELDPSVRPGVVADALFAVPIFCAGAAAGVEPTARPSPLKFLSEGLPKQLPMVMKLARRDCTEVCKVSCAVSIYCAVGYSECDSPPPRAQPCPRSSLGAWWRGSTLAMPRRWLACSSLQQGSRTSETPTTSLKQNAFTPNISIKTIHSIDIVINDCLLGYIHVKIPAS